MWVTEYRTIDKQTGMVRLKKPSLFFYCVLAKTKQGEEMVSTNRLFKLALNVKNCRVIGARIEAGRDECPKVVVEVRTYK